MRWGLLALALVGCAVGPIDEAPGPYAFSASTVSIDPAFSDEAREAICWALAEWSTVTKAPLRRPWRIVLEAPTPPPAVLGFTAEDAVLGFADTDNALIQIRPGLRYETFRSTILHELGHAHGVWEHSAHGVMQATLAAPPIVEFSEDDLAVCRRDGVC